MKRLVIVAAAFLCGAGLAMDSPASARPGGRGFGGGARFAGVGSFHGGNIAGRFHGANITGRSVATPAYGRYRPRNYGAYGAAGLGLLGLGLGYGLAAPYYGYGCPYIDAYGNCVGDPGYAYGW